MIKYELGKIYNAFLNGEDRTFEVLGIKLNKTLGEAYTEYTMRWDDGDEEWNYDIDIDKWVNDFKERQVPNHVGRPSIGVTKKVSVTLPEEDWKRIFEIVDHGHAASLSDYFRQLHSNQFNGG